MNIAAINEKEATHFKKNKGCVCVCMCVKFQREEREGCNDVVNNIINLKNKRRKCQLN